MPSAVAQEPLTIQAALTAAKDQGHPRLHEAQEKILLVADTCVGSVCRSWRGNLTVQRLLPDVEDLSQECRLTLLGKVVRDFDPSRIEGRDEDAAERMFCGYAMRALQARMLDVLKVQGRRPGLVSGMESSARSHWGSGREARLPFVETAADTRDSAIEPCGTDEREVFGSLKGVLGAHDFDIAYLRYEGYSVREVARLVGITPKTVRSRIRDIIAPAIRAKMSALGYPVTEEPQPVV